MQCLLRTTPTIVIAHKMPSNYVLCISTYLGFLWVVLPNKGIIILAQFKTKLSKCHWDPNRKLEVTIIFQR